MLAEAAAFLESVVVYSDRVVKHGLVGLLRRQNKRAVAEAEDKQLQAERAVNELCANLAELHVGTGEILIGALRPQVVTLWSYAQAWGDVDAYTRAVEALTRFYFGEAGDDDELLAETQLAWMAYMQISHLALFRKSARDRRTRARQRYHDLWQAWAASWQAQDPA